MSQQPTRVALKRKASEDPPEILFLQNQQGTAAAATTQQLHYVRETRTDATSAGNDEPRRKKAKSQGEFVKRIFQLDRKRKLGGEGDGGAPDDKVATVMEKRVGTIGDSSGVDVDAFEHEAPQSFKRPSRQLYAVAAPTTNAHESEEDRKRFEQLSEEMQQYAMEEADRERRVQPQFTLRNRDQQPRMSHSPEQYRQRITPPKLSGKRSSEIHRRRLASSSSNPGSTDSSSSRLSRFAQAVDEGDYVYDTYILSAGQAEPSAMDIDSDKVGYLVITEEDEELWQTFYIDEETAAHDREIEKIDEDEDEEDENAEDFHGADYPEHDLSEDDEMGNDQAAYGFHWDRRAGGGVEDESDHEEWDEDEAQYSGDEGDGNGLDFGDAFDAGKYRRLEAKFLKS